MYQLDKLGDEQQKERSELQSVFSRGKLPQDVGDIGSLAIHGNEVAVAVDGGEVLLLSPKA